MVDVMTSGTVNVGDLPLLGKGKTGEIYALDENLAMKLYHREIPKENAVRNYRLLKASKEAGIPVPAVYEMIEIDGRDGMVMDRVNGLSFDTLIAGASRAKRNGITDRFADCIRRIHRVRVENKHLQDILPDQKARSLELADSMIPAGFTKEERDKACVILSGLPACDTWIHGDCHTGNVVLCGEDPVFLDLNIFTGRGDPLLDLMCMYSHYMFHPSLMSEKEVFRYLGMTAQEGREVYDRFLRVYTGDQPDSDEEAFEKLKGDIIRVHAARFCIMAASNPQLFSHRAVDKARGVLT